MSLEPYQHEPLPDAQKYIRLVKIHPASKKDPLTITIEAYERNLAPAYTALSYTWGDKQLTKGISANGKLLLVTKNCWYALGQLRLNNICDYCWVDAICINQVDDAEKSAQVNLMGTIYRNASLGAIAVGRHDRATEDLFRILEGLGVARDFGRTEISLDQIEHESLESLARGLVALGMHAYWNRIWIVQEFALAPKAILLCGHGSVSFDAITALTNSLKEDAGNGTPRLTTRYDRTMMESTPMSATMRLRRMIRESPEGLIPFERLLDLLGPRQCSDVRDRIFGMLSLVQWESNVEPLVADYSLSRTELAAKTLQLYKGHQLYAASRVLQLLDFGPNEHGMWKTWESRMLSRQPGNDRSASASSTSQISSFQSIARSVRITEETKLQPWSDHWFCLSEPQDVIPIEGMKAVDLEVWLNTRRILLPAASRPGDILISISRPHAPVGDGDSHESFDNSALVLRPTGSVDDVEHEIVGHVLFFPDNDFLSLHAFDLELVDDKEFHLHVDDNDLLFWVWQQLHWSSELCDNLEISQQSMEVFAAQFCHSPLSSFATWWQRPRYHRETSDLDFGAFSG